jgi:hypothetical protein
MKLINVLLKFKFLLLLIIFFASNYSYAWGLVGHRITGEVAQSHLKPKTKENLKNILSNLDLSDISFWADEIKSDTNYDHWENLHYASFKKEILKYNEEHKNKKGDVVTATTVLYQFLKTKDKNALKSVESLSQISEIQAIKLLIHFIGDIHQPLHIGYMEDRGANLVKIKWMNYKNMNLHQVWDEELVEYNKMSYTEFTNYLNRKYKDQLKTSSNFEVINWANESRDLLPQIYNFTDDKYKFKSKLPVIYYGYIFRNKEILEKRLYLAGLRIAHALNSLYQ